MALTEEQKERIKQNRERALRIKKERMERLAKEKEDADKKRKLNQGGGGGGREGETLQAATIRNEDVVRTSNKKQKLQAAKKQQEEEKDDLELEEFEVGASEWITKSEAMKMYCVPQGTLAVCQVEERPNPHHASWKPMKLYLRSQVRQKGRKRFGGLEGLVEERNKRRQKQLEKDMAKARSIFE
eukprot:CAMPEP_0113638934 /NCGR_PEP_ID=MMETSP0017_2-20120614/20412_1 /TAXON_ID=2856 /ORGANISM="Cylindrotheca closterium" /LENGTH=184 /DNA_ID=CAMNT_0000550097 /DNA_START=436 /DNA_END=990 /DNA_ORIENTATION=- /assembly_acc=CAM_ASM_000147